MHHKSVMSKIPPYFKDNVTPLVSYSYTKPIASRIFNHVRTLQDLSINDLILNPPSCSCQSSPFVHKPIGHVITGDLNFIDNPKLRSILSKGPKFREPRSFTWKGNFIHIMEAVEEHARKWAKREKVETDTLSEWVKAIRTLVLKKISILSRIMSTRNKSVFDDPVVTNSLESIHQNFVVVPADKASNNIVFVCKAYYIKCLFDELGISNNTSTKNTYIPTPLSKESIVNNHISVLHSFGIDLADSKELSLPKLFWIPKLHKYPYKQRFIAGSSTCSTKALSRILTIILSKIKQGLQKYCDTIYSRCGINHMWILKNSKTLLEYLQSHSFDEVTSIKTFISQLYTQLFLIQV